MRPLTEEETKAVGAPHSAIDRAAVAPICVMTSFIPRFLFAVESSLSSDLAARVKILVDAAAGNDVGTNADDEANAVDATTKLIKKDVIVGFSSLRMSA